jgi:hypothetical protein
VNAPPEIPIITAAVLGDVKPICPRLGGGTGTTASTNCAVVACRSSMQRSPPVRRRGSAHVRTPGRSVLGANATRNPVRLLCLESRITRAYVFRVLPAQMDERERMCRIMVDLVERMPAPPAKPVEEWTSQQLLSKTVRQGLINSLHFQQEAIRTRDSLDEEPLSADEIRLQRLVDESTRGWGKILAGIQLSACSKRRALTGCGRRRRLGRGRRASAREPGPLRLLAGP